MFIIKMYYPTDHYYRYASVIFLEAKGDKGKQREDQHTFQELVEAQGAEYHIVRSLDEVIDILS